MAESDTKSAIISSDTPKNLVKAKTHTKAKRTKKAKKSLGICFTIMPFGGWFQDYYKNIYRPAIESVGLSPHRADDLYRPSTIVNDIWTYTREAKLVLADLTGKNPNVFYELGLAHALAKPAILVAESMDDVPFDLRSLRVIEYDKNDSGWGKTLRTKIESAILEVLDAPLQAVLPAFLDVEPKKDRISVSKQEKAMLEIRQELDLLRSQIRRSDINSRVRDINPAEASRLIGSYLMRGMPSTIIIDRLVSRGAPEKWVIEEIETQRLNMLHSKQLELPPLSEAVKSKKTTPVTTAKKKKYQKSSTKSKKR